MKKITIYYVDCPCQSTRQQKALFNWFKNQTKYQIERKRVVENPDWLKEAESFKTKIPFVVFDGKIKNFDFLLELAGVKEIK